METNSPTKPAVEPGKADHEFQALQVNTAADGIVTILLNAPGKSVNTISQLLQSELNELLARIEKSAPRGIIFASAKKRSFIVGADLFELTQMTPGQANQYLADGQALFTRIENLPCATVAAINGDCLGGGYELALACKARVAADDPVIKIGLPEVKLGLVPGFGGTVRLPRLIALANSLPLMLTGKALSPSEALTGGLVDAIVPADELHNAAGRFIANPPARPSRQLPPDVATNILNHARTGQADESRGDGPSPARLIDVVQAGWELGPQAGFEAERKTLVDLMATDATKSLIGQFFQRQSAKKAAGGQPAGALTPLIMNRPPDQAEK